MTTVPSTATKAVGDKVSTNWANNNVQSPVDFLILNKPLAFFVQSVAQTGWTSGTFTAVTFTSEVLDRDGQHNNVTNTSRVVIGNTLGWYKVSGLYGAAGNTAATLVRATIALNGTRFVGAMNTVSPTSTGSALAVPTGTVLIQATSASDYIELHAQMVAASGTIGTSVSADFASSLTVEFVGA